VEAGASFVGRGTSRQFATVDEEYLPQCTAFEICDDSHSATKLGIGDNSCPYVAANVHRRTEKDGYVFADLSRHVDELYPNKVIEDSLLKLRAVSRHGFDVLMSFGFHQPDEIEIDKFNVAENSE